jgi:hypothetical protein
MAIEQVNTTASTDGGPRTRSLEAIDDNKGVIEAWMGLSVSAAEQLTTISFGALRDTRWITHQTLTTLLNTLESLQQAGLRLARGATERADQAALRLIDDSERAVLRTIGAAKRTAQSATGFASETAGSLVGRRTSSVGVS